MTKGSDLYQAAIANRTESLDGRVRDFVVTITRDRSRYLRTRHWHAVATQGLFEKPIFQLKNIPSKDVLFSMANDWVYLDASRQGFNDPKITWRSVYR